MNVEEPDALPVPLCALAVALSSLSLFLQDADGRKLFFLTRLCVRYVMTVKSGGSVFEHLSAWALSVGAA